MRRWRIVLTGRAIAMHPSREIRAGMAKVTSRRCGVVGACSVKILGAEFMRPLLAGIALSISILCYSCGVSNPNASIITTVPNALNNCLEKHGVMHPDDTPPPSEQEAAIPGLLGTYGLRVPRGTTKGRFEAALKQCGLGDVHIGQVPITSVILQQRIRKLRTCLLQNGFSLPPADFSGNRPVFDTSRINIQSARWAATVKGCEVTGRDGYTGPVLSKSLLVMCLGKKGLEGAAKTNTMFQSRILELPNCLRRAH